MNAIRHTNSAHFVTRDTSSLRLFLAAIRDFADGEVDVGGRGQG